MTLKKSIILTYISIIVLESSLNLEHDHLLMISYYIIILLGADF